MSSETAIQSLAEGSEVSGGIVTVEFCVVFWLYMLAVVTGIVSVLLHVVGFQHATAVGVSATTIGFAAGAISCLDYSTLVVRLGIQ